MRGLPVLPSAMNTGADLPDGAPDDNEAKAFFDRLMRGPLQLRNDSATSARTLTHAEGRNGIGPWTLGPQIGRGGMSHVYEASRETPSGTQHAALKLARHASAKARALFRREAQVLTRLGTRHVAAVMDAGIHTDGRPYLALEHVTGQRITEAARHRIVRERVRLLLRACQAISVLHDQDIVHGDLKPEHLIVRSDDTVAVLDLGLAVDLASSSTPRANPKRSLTPEFAAPEQILGEPIYRATDVYSIGLVLHEVLHGRARRMPWSLGGTPDASMLRPKHLHAQGPANSAEEALDYALVPILQTALQPNPHLRFVSASAMAVALTRALASVTPGTAHA